MLGMFYSMLLMFLLKYKNMFQFSISKSMFLQLFFSEQIGFVFFWFVLIFSIFGTVR